jgi:hypothetical protein
LTRSSNLQEFLRDFETYRAVYDRIRGTRELEIANHLFAMGREIEQGTKPWTKSDLKTIVRYRRMSRLIPRIENAPDIEESLADAFRIQDEPARINALCKIPGIGPVLASAILTFTSPGTYAPLDCHAWNALGYLGFHLPKKGISNGSFTTAELLEFLKIVRKLAEEKTTTPTEIHKALYASDQARTSKRWSWQKRKIELGIVNSFPNPFRVGPLTEEGIESAVGIH